MFRRDEHATRAAVPAACALPVAASGCMDANPFIDFLQKRACGAPRVLLAQPVWQALAGELARRPLLSGERAMAQCSMSGPFEKTFETE